MSIIFLAIGFVLLIKCAEVFVDGASSVAKNLKIPATVIGLTVVAFGTSAPELAVSISAHLSGSTDVMVGNVIGSNIVNILLILGLAAVIVPIKINHIAVNKELPILTLITVGMAVLFADSVFTTDAPNALTRGDGIILLLLFAVFVYYLFTLIRSSGTLIEENEIKAKYKPLMSVVATIIGVTGIIIGSKLAVDGAVGVAGNLGISEKIISLTIIAIGTSLPELITTVIAARKKETSLALGNIVGSNIFNICVVLGLPIAVFGGVVPSAFNLVDILVMITAALILFLCASTHRRITRAEGLSMLALFVVYYALLFVIS
jgi:cation:H+ antiporter